MKAKLIVIFIFIICISAHLKAEPITLLLAYENKEQPPYYFGSTTKIPSKPGIAVDIVKRLEKKISDLRIKLVRYPWKRCLFHLQKGEVDGLFKASYKQDRTKLGRYPMQNGKIDPARRIAMMSNSLYKLKQTKIGWNGMAFNKVNGYVCSPRGYYVTSILKEKNIKIVESDSSMNCMEKTLRKRVIASALQTVTGDALLKKYPERFKTLEKVNPPISTKPQYLMLSHQFVAKHPQLAERIWDTIAVIRKEDLEDIVLQYSE